MAKKEKTIMDMADSLARKMAKDKYFMEPENSEAVLEEIRG